MFPITPPAALETFLDAAETVLRGDGGQTKAEWEGPPNSTPSAPKSAPFGIPGGGYLPTTREDVASALDAVPNNVDWHDWVKIGAAIWDALADDGEDLFLTWSARSPRDESKKTRRKWASFKTSPMNIKAGTLFYFARQRGWQRDPAFWAPRAPLPDERWCTARPRRCRSVWTRMSRHLLDPIDDPGYRESVDAEMGQSTNPVTALLAEFNARYMVVNEAGRAIIYEAVYDGMLKRPHFTRITFSMNFRKFSYLNRRIKVGDKKVRVADFWLASPARRQFLGGVVFDPSERHVPSDGLNLWRGFAVEPRKGSWRRLQRHIYRVICGRNKAQFKYLLRWMARLVQRPAEQGEVAVVMRGGEGTGKGTLAKALLHILGQHGLAISNSKHLTGNFNGHLRDTVLLFADEAFFAGDRAHVGVLKSLITEPFLTIEAKYQTAVQMPNFVHLMMASNEEWIITASLDARRFFVLEVSAERVDDHAYFAAIWAEMNAGGYEAMLHDLLAIDLTFANVRRVPVTEGLQQQRKLSLGTSEAWWMDVLHRGYVFRSKLGLEAFFADWHAELSTEVLFASYEAFAKERHERHAMSRETFGRFMTNVTGGKPKRMANAAIGERIADVQNLHGGTSRRAEVTKHARPPGYVLGALDAARAVFTQKTGLGGNWPPEQP